MHGEEVQKYVALPKLGRTGDDLLSRVLRHSTIGAVRFLHRVRNGIVSFTYAKITGSSELKQRKEDDIKFTSVVASIW